VSLGLVYAIGLLVNHLNVNSLMTWDIARKLPCRAIGIIDAEQ
jgi:hypothetical protein